MSVFFSPTQRDLLERLSEVRTKGLSLDTPSEKRAALALAKGCMVTMNQEHSQAAITRDGRERLKLARAADRDMATADKKVDPPRRPRLR